MVKTRDFAKDLRYLVVSGQMGCEGKNWHPAHNSFLASIYHFWKTEWSQVFSEIHPDFEVNKESFFSQTRITALLWRESIVAVQTLTDNKLFDFIDNPYFKDYRVEFLQTLVRKKISRFQSMQHLIVGQRYGVWQCGLNLSAIILGLNFKHQEFLNLQATIGLGRKDNASANTARKFNMLQVGPDIELHNVPVGQLLCEKPAIHPKKAVQDLIDRLWTNSDFYQQKRKYKEGETTYAN